MELTENHIPLTVATLNARARNAHARQVPQLLEVTKSWFKHKLQRANQRTPTHKYGRHTTGLRMFTGTLRVQPYNILFYGWLCSVYLKSQISGTDTDTTYKVPAAHFLILPPAD